MTNTGVLNHVTGIHMVFGEKKLMTFLYYLIITKIMCSVIYSMMNFNKIFKLQPFQNLNEKFELVFVNMFF